MNPAGAVNPSRVRSGAGPGEQSAGVSATSRIHEPFRSQIRCARPGSCARRRGTVAWGPAGDGFRPAGAVKPAVR
jgi:hypothetical protein